jgi:hypothetical protein
VKPISARAFRKDGWPAPVNALFSLMVRPLLALSRSKSTPSAGVRAIRSFDERFTALWERVASKFTFAVRRDAAYLQWKYVALPHIRYEVIALDRGGEIAGYAVFRHVDEPRGRVTALVDLLADPDDRDAVVSLLNAVEHEARTAGSDKIRAFVMNAAFRATMRAQGYFHVRSTIELVAKVNAVPVDERFYADTGAWHVMFGDSDQDR